MKIGVTGGLYGITVIKLYNFESGPIHVEIYSLPNSRKPIGEVHLSRNEDTSEYDGEVPELVKAGLGAYILDNPDTLLVLEKGGFDLGPFQHVREDLGPWFEEMPLDFRAKNRHRV